MGQGSRHRQGNQAKAARLLASSVRDAVKKALAGPGMTRTKVVAAIVRLIDRALLRPGYEEYARSEGGRGASTLLKSDVSVNGDQVVLMFKGKGGKEIRRELRDPIARARSAQVVGCEGAAPFQLARRQGRQAAGDRARGQRFPCRGQWLFDLC